MIRSSSSRAARVRTSWFILIIDIKGAAKELHIGWKYSDGSIGLYSDAGSRSKSRPPWGYVIDCSLQTPTNKRNETSDYMLFQNRAYQKKAYKCNEMNPVLSGVNDFTTCIVGMRSEGRENILAMFLSLMVKSKDFSFHKDGVHDEYGVNLDKTGVTEETLNEQGSNIGELASFVNLALKCAVRVVTRTEAISKLECGQKRKSSDDIPVKAKLSKVDKVVDENICKTIHKAHMKESSKEANINGLCLICHVADDIVGMYHHHQDDVAHQKKHSWVNSSRSKVEHEQDNAVHPCKDQEQVRNEHDYAASRICSERECTIFLVCYVRGV